MKVKFLVNYVLEINCLKHVKNFSHLLWAKELKLLNKT